MCPAPAPVNPPRAQQPGADEPVAAIAPVPAAQPTPTRVASATPTQESEGFFASLARKVGIGGASGDTTASASPAPAKPKTTEAKPLAKAFKPAETRQAESKLAPRPALKRRRTADRAAQLVRQPLLGHEVGNATALPLFPGSVRPTAASPQAMFPSPRSTLDHFAPFNRQDVAQVVVTPRSHLMQAAMH